MKRLDSTLKIRINSEDKAALLAYCESQEIPYGRFLRALIRNGIRSEEEAREAHRTRKLTLTDGTRLG